MQEPLQFEDGPAYLVKTDILREIMYFSYDKGSLSNLYPLSPEEVREIIAMNRDGERPESLKLEPEPVGPQFVSAVGDDSITRFDKPKKGKRRNKKRISGGKGDPPAQGNPAQGSARHRQSRGREARNK